jgi:prevent-host-death family protein
MKQVGIKQARQQLPDLIDRVEAGEEIMISRQGRPVAQLIPAPRNLKQLPTLLEFRRGIGSPGCSSAQLLRAERDER